MQSAKTPPRPALQYGPRERVLPVLNFHATFLLKHEFHASIELSLTQDVISIECKQTGGPQLLQALQT